MYFSSWWKKTMVVCSGEGRAAAAAEEEEEEVAHVPERERQRMVGDMGFGHIFFPFFCAGGKIGGSEVGIWVDLR